jgi:hypothetical protein
MEILIKFAIVRGQAEAILGPGGPHREISECSRQHDQTKRSAIVDQTNNKRRAI